MTLGSWPAWKKAEVEAAKLLGGTRRVRINYSESVEDVIHAKYAIEVKQGNQIPKYCIVKEPVIYTTVSDAYILFHSSDIDILEDRTSRGWLIQTQEQKNCEFIEKAIEQARSYDRKKVPLVCLKPCYFRGLILVMHYSDWFFIDSEDQQHPLQLP